MNLDDWNAKFGGKVNPFASPSKRFPFAENQAYRLECKSARVAHGPRNDVQIHTECAVYGSDDEHAESMGQSTEKFTLPYQQTDLTANEDFVPVLTQRRMADVKRLYSAALPAEYATYSHAKVPDGGGRARYYDFNDKPMDKLAFEERDATINKRLDAVVRNLHDNIGQAVDDLAGMTMWIVKVPNKKNPDFPYTNVYMRAPDKYPMAVEGETVDI